MSKVLPRFATLVAAALAYGAVSCAGPKPAASLASATLPATPCAGACCRSQCTGSERNRYLLRICDPHVCPLAIVLFSFRGKPTM